MKAITLFVCFVIVYANPEQPTPASDRPVSTVNTVVGVNQPVNLTCSFSESYSNPQAIWGKKIPGSKLDGTKTGYLQSQNSFDTYLYIENTTLNDAGTYECIVSVAGRTERWNSQNLIVTETPTITIDRVEELEDSDKVFLKWTVNKPNFAPEYYKIERATVNGTFLDPEVVDKGETEKTIDLPKNLTAYRFRIHACTENETHISPYSKWIDTAAGKKSKYVLKFEVTNTTKNLIELTWKEPSQEDKLEVDHYEIILDNTTKKKTTEKSGTYITYQLENLTCGTNYTIDVAACSHVQSLDDCSNRSGEISVRTKECKNADSAASFLQQANGILVIMIGLCFSNKYYA